MMDVRKLVHMSEHDNYRHRQQTVTGSCVQNVTQVTNMINICVYKGPDMSCHKVFHFMKQVQEGIFRTLSGNSVKKVYIVRQGVSDSSKKYHITKTRCHQM